MTTNAPWTANQNSEIINAFTQQPSPQYIEFEVRNGLEYFTKSYPNSPLRTGTKVRIYKADIYKSISNGDGQSITQTIKMFN